MTLQKYLKAVDEMCCGEDQQAWFKKLAAKATCGAELLQQDREKRSILTEFNSRMRTEEIKAWYSTPERDSLFQGTSVSSLTIPHAVDIPLQPQSMEELEDIVAQAYVEHHDRHKSTVQGAIQEDTSEWISRGLFYGIVLCSKIVSQALGLSIKSEDVIFEVDGYVVDPHEITHYPLEIRDRYFEKCREKVSCFEGLDLDRREFESSLALADISKPRIKKYKDKILLAPVRCNEICAMLSRGIREKVIERTGGRINPKSLAVVLYDTDTPYTYHDIMGHTDRAMSPVLPGLVVLGSSGTMDAFRWLYTYRVSLLTQYIQKGSLYSQVCKRFIPFVFYGVLVWRDAEILLEMEKLSMLRYRGNISPDLEFSYIAPGLVQDGQAEKSHDSLAWFKEKHCTDKGR